MHNTQYPRRGTRAAEQMFKIVPLPECSHIPHCFQLWGPSSSIIISEPRAADDNQRDTPVPARAGERRRRRGARNAREKLVHSDCNQRGSIRKNNNASHSRSSNPSAVPPAGATGVDAALCATFFCGWGRSACRTQHER